VKPAVPSKKPGLGVGCGSGSVIHPNTVVNPPAVLMKDEPYVNIEQPINCVSITSLLDDSVNMDDSLPPPMKPSNSRKLPPPPRPSSGPCKKPDVPSHSGSGVSGRFHAEYQRIETTASKPNGSESDHHDSDAQVVLETTAPSTLETQNSKPITPDETEELVAEPVYALVRNKQLRKDATNLPASDGNLNTSSVADHLPDDEQQLPPTVPVSRPSISDHESKLIPQVETLETDAEREITDLLGLDSVVVPESKPKPPPKPKPRRTAIPPLSVDDSTTVAKENYNVVESTSKSEEQYSSNDQVYESVGFEKGGMEIETVPITDNPEEIAEHSVLLVEENGSEKPPLPATRPVGFRPSKAPSPKSASPVARKDVPPDAEAVKREKISNSHESSLNVIRRKSSKLKEKGFKIFRQRPSVEEVGKPKYVDENRQDSAAASGSTSTTAESSVTPAKPKRVPPPRPALPAILQKKIVTSKDPNVTDNKLDPRVPGSVTTVASSVETSSNQNTRHNLSKSSQSVPVRPPAIKSATKSMVQADLATTHNNQRGPGNRDMPAAHDDTSAAAFSEMMPQSRPSGLTVLPKPKPARPPPAMLPIPPLTLTKVKRGEDDPVPVDGEQRKPEIDERMKEYAKAEQFCVATADYHPTNFTDISFQCGEKISVMKIIDEFTYFGRNEDGDEGTFPKHLVKLESESDNENNSNVDVVRAFENSANANNNSNNNKSEQCVPLQQVVAQFDYTSGEASDLNFSAGEIIDVIEIVSDDWLKGSTAKKTGIFPKAFVAPLTVQRVPFPRSKRETMTDPMANIVSPVPSARVTSTPVPLAKCRIKGNCTSSDSEMIVASDTSEKSNRSVVLPAKTVARFSFTGEDDSELSFHTNDIILVTSKISCYSVIITRAVYNCRVH